MRKFLVVAVALAFTGCAERDAIDFASPASISITRHILHGGSKGAGKKATAHCNKYNKDAVLVSRQPDVTGYFEVMNFRCVSR